MRHDMSQVLSTPHPHATLSPQLPSLPLTTYLLTPYSPPYWTLSRWLRAAFGADVAQRVEMEMWKRESNLQSRRCRCRARCSCSVAAGCAACWWLLPVVMAAHYAAAFYVSRHRNLKWVRVPGVRMHKESCNNDKKEVNNLRESNANATWIYIIYIVCHGIYGTLCHTISPTQVIACVQSANFIHINVSSKTSSSSLRWQLYEVAENCIISDLWEFSVAFTS